MYDAYLCVVLLTSGLLWVLSETGASNWQIIGNFLWRTTDRDIRTFTLVQRRYMFIHNTIQYIENLLCAAIQKCPGALTRLKYTRSWAVAVIADRTACSILTLFIVSTTSRPLNKKSVCCQSLNPINNYCGSASANSQSAHLSARALQSALGSLGTRFGGRTERHCADSQP